MSSWVAPSVAADIWGTTVEQILARVAEGSIPSKMSGEFLFVDVAFQGFAQSSPRAAAFEPIVTPAEIAALKIEPISEAPIEPLRDFAGEPADEEALREPDDDGGIGQRDVSQWRAVRQQTARLRIPPGRRAA